MIRLILLMFFIPAICRGNELPYDYWERQYRHCLDTADVVVIGEFKSHELLETAGYNHYKVGVKVLHPLKNFTAKSLYFYSWYEDHSVKKRNGKGLFCLCYKTENNLVDPSGNSIYPVNVKLLEYAKDYTPKQSTEKWSPICDLK